jgi:hypothetical protein
MYKKKFKIETIGHIQGHFVVVMLLLGRQQTQEVPIEDLPEERHRIRLVRRHDRERQGDLHKVPSPQALQF